MIRTPDFTFILLKFMHMSKLLCNVLKFFGGQMPQIPPGYTPASTAMQTTLSKSCTVHGAT